LTAVIAEERKTEKKTLIYW